MPCEYLNRECPAIDKLRTRVAELEVETINQQDWLVEWRKAEARVDELGHESNEWADCACNALQYLRNIADGLSSPQEAITNIEKNIAHCQEVHKSGSNCLFSHSLAPTTRI